jgi:prepilin-type N-terminal cleavage/methylation domain-containing protein
MGKITNNKGFTLVEMVLVMAIFIVIIIITTYAFENILKKSGQQGKIAQSGIEGRVGLEMMRSDIGKAGYGLFWELPKDSSGVTIVPDYDTEVDGSPATGLGVDATIFNDDPNDANIDKKIPRAIVSGTGAAGTNFNIDYLVVKGTALGMGPSSKRWNFVKYVSVNNGKLQRRGPDDTWDSATHMMPEDRVVTFKSTYDTSGGGDENRVLVVDTDNDNAFFYAVPDTTSPDEPVLDSSNVFKPSGPSQRFIAYGVSNTNLRMPYNRVDFFVDKNPTPPMPATCNPGTGVLYKAVADHQNPGGFTNYPILNCVGDMQVVFYRDVSGTLTPINEGVISTMTAKEIREEIKSVQVFLLIHEGKKDPGFSYPSDSICVAPYSGSCLSAVGRNWSNTQMAATFGGDWRNYRWKVINLDVILKNLK